MFQNSPNTAMNNYSASPNTAFNSAPPRQQMPYPAPPFTRMPPPPQSYIYQPNIQSSNNAEQKPIINFDGHFVQSFDEIKNENVTGNFANIYPLNNWSKIAVRTFDETGKIKTLYFGLERQEYPMTMDDMSKRLDNIENALLAIAASQKQTTKKTAQTE